MPLENPSEKYTKLITYFLGFITFILCVYILMALKDILIPVTIAIFLTYLFHPLIDIFKKVRIPQWLTLVIILIVLFGIYYLIGLLVVSNFGTFQSKMQSYAKNLSAFIQQLLNPFNITVAQLGQMLGFQIEKFDVSTFIEKLFRAGIIQNLFSSFSSMLGDFFITMIFWILMMLGKNRFEDRLKIAFESRRKIVEKNLNSINKQLQSYIIIKTIISLITGTIVTIILLAYGIDYAVFWGVLTFILNYIPNIGSLIATVFPIIISFFEYGFGFTTISLIILLVVNQNVMGNLVEPHYMGRRMDLSTVFVLFSLIFWGWIWGIVGMFLSVPIAASIKILFSNIEPLKPFAVIMGSKAERIEEL
jgi:AI-2 transport protein TqsA